MIPEFPIFKRLDISDREDVEMFTSKYVPYSDHNFLGTWSSDFYEKIQISRLNNNYVGKFADYTTGESFYTFLGIREVTDTAKKLLDLATKENMPPVLRLIPENCLDGLDASIFKIDEDRDNFDYIYSIEDLSTLQGGAFKNKRNQVAGFLRQNPEAEFKQLNIGIFDTQNELIDLLKKWIINKPDPINDFELHHDMIMLKKFFSEYKKFNLMTFGVYINSKLCAFLIVELKDNDYVVGHVAKADISIKGINEYLLQKSAEVLFLNGKKFFNNEQDLGIEKMRMYKTQLRPLFFLKKYKISYL